MAITVTEFGKTSDGRTAHKITLDNGTIRVSALDFGATLQEITVKDRDGNPVDVCLGFGDVSAYETQGGSLGAVVGRFANRLKNARFWMDGREYRLPPNEGANLRHGGPLNFARRMFDSFAQTEDNEVCFTLCDPGREDGFPGNFELKVYYSILPEGALQLRYRAVCDHPTPLNLTNHAYFNLNGHNSGSVLEHRLRMDADRITVLDEGNVPTGELRAVAGTVYDFLQERRVGDQVDAPELLEAAAKGYDQNYVFSGSGMRPVAWLTSPQSGITMTVTTALPGLQLYSANSLHATVPCKDGVTFYGPRTGLCLETQYFPDWPNHPEWNGLGGDFLRPGQVYDETTVYSFSAF